MRNEWFDKFRLCLLCGRNGCDTFVPAYGIYGEDSGAEGCHSSCLSNVMAEPEKYGHKLVDRALHLADRIKEEKEAKIRMDIRFVEKCAKARFLNENEDFKEM